MSTCMEAQFEVILDNNSLTYVLTTAKLDATGQSWVATLSGYNFSIKYRSGKKNADADGLSRSRESEEQRVISPETLKAVSRSLSIKVQDCSLLERLAVSNNTRTSQKEDISEQLLITYGLSPKDWRKAQLNDPCISFILNEVQAGANVPARRNLNQVG